MVRSTLTPMTADLPDRGDTVRAVTAREQDAGERLDRLLAAQLGELSRTRLKHLIEAGRVSLGGATIRDPSMRVKPGQSFAVSVPPPVADRPEPQAIALDIRFEDEHVIVVDKPAGLVVHPAPGNPDRTLVNALLAHCGASLAGIGGVRRPGIVHRLDKDTSGLMVVAKTELAHARLAADFAARRIERAYRRAGLGRAGAASRARSRRRSAAARATARTWRWWRAAASARSRATACCALFTARRGAGRVPARHRPHPPDPRPSRRARPSADRRPHLWRRARRRPDRRGAEPAREALDAFPRQALHAQLLGFVHPATGETLRFESDLPSDMAAVGRILECLKLDEPTQVSTRALAMSALALRRPWRRPTLCRPSRIGGQSFALSPGDPQVPDARAERGVHARQALARP